ncbi:hypothetical protein CEXT_162521 [Caerostris extrusa]|uniref:Uncharacterized protein n=1 Tax=Caerostris extrusa TaxID=172846 RepID=A0AAV4M7K4_CAEEX|nr:hypothetical protein CEXT_162521 [Caerostris extrusa]
MTGQKEALKNKLNCQDAACSSIRGIGYFSKGHPSLLLWKKGLPFDLRAELTSVPRADGRIEADLSHLVVAFPGSKKSHNRGSLTG